MTSNESPQEETSDVDRTPEVRSAGFLIYRDQPQRQILLMKHVDRWDLPKGHVDPGETIQEAALRELQEETGIRPDQIEIDPDFRYVDRYWVNARSRGDRKLKELVIFLARLKEDVPIQFTEHIGYEWLDWAPPHKIQKWTIDPLLAAVDQHWKRHDHATEPPRPTSSS